MAAKWFGDEMFYFQATKFYTMLDKIKIITNLMDRYDNKESSVIYYMASIINDKSVADQVVQRVVRFCHALLKVTNWCQKSCQFGQGVLRITAA